MASLLPDKKLINDQLELIKKLRDLGMGDIAQDLSRDWGLDKQKPARPEEVSYERAMKGIK